MSSRPHVVVVGGGLPGLTAGIICADAGVRVTVLEGRPRLGGATWSFERNGLSFDNGQHVYLRCCSAYRWFLERVGTADSAPLQERLAIPVLRPPASPGDPPALFWIRRNDLPAPGHLARSLLGYGHLSLWERARLGPAVAALLRLDPQDPAVDGETFATWLSRHGQSDAAIERLWGLITLPTVNLPASEASLALAVKVFQTGLLTHRDAADIGWARIPLGDLHGRPAAAALGRAGATVRRRAKVEAIRTTPGARSDDAGESVVSVVLADGEIEADAVVLAVPHDAAGALLPAGACADPTAFARLGTSPIVDVHLVFDRRVTEMPIAAAIDSPVQFVFDRTEAAGLDPKGDRQCLAVSVSAADSELGERPEVLIDRYVAALHALFPASRGASVLDAVVSRERAATFRGGPGTAALRPGAITTCPSLFLAGAWTDTGWPATMEGAVRSGITAGNAALTAARTQRRAEGVVACIPTQNVPEVLGRARDLVTPDLRTAVGRLSPELRPVAEYHLGWDSEHPSSGGGKGLRPALAILSAELVGAPASAGVPGAVAVELVHNFSLVHDDVIDGDEERRHRPTVWALYGIGPAVIAGDAMLALAQQVALEVTPQSLSLRAARCLADATAAMIAGQALDMAFESLEYVDLEQCLAMEEGKTGALLGCAASIGAILGAASEEVVEPLRRFGIEVGLAFQAVDDLLGIWGDPARTGKPSWSDLRQRKKSLPVAAALGMGGQSAEELAGILASPDELDEERVARAATLVELCGGREVASAQVQLHLDAALAALGAIDPAAERAREELAQLARFAAAREF